MTGGPCGGGEVRFLAGPPFTEEYLKPNMLRLTWESKHRQLANYEVSIGGKYWIKIREDGVFFGWPWSISVGSSSTPVASGVAQDEKEAVAAVDAILQVHQRAVSRIESVRNRRVRG